MLLKLLIAVLFYSFKIGHVRSQTATVTTTLGTFQGSIITTPNGNLVQLFQRIPYAQAPTAATRFTRSVPLTTLSPNPFTSTTAPLPCARWGTDGKTMDAQSDEDCLYLKILSLANVTCCQPVMFWIQSGGFNDGGYPAYDNNALGDNFAAKGVVVVQVDHRQGPFGFFTTGTADAPGNWGVWDALQALKFARTILSSFGGDINRITIMGQESGAVMAELLSLSPLARGLYSAMMLIDGTAFDPAVIKNDNVTLARSQRLAYLVNCDDSTRDLWGNGQRLLVTNCLRNNVTTAQLVSAIGRQDIRTSDPGSTIYNYFWRPVVDGANGLFPDTFDRLATQRPLVPTILGAMHRDWLIDLLPFESDRTNTLPANFNATFNTPAFVNQTCINLMTTDIYGTLATTLVPSCVGAYINNQVVDSPYYWTHRAARVSTGLHLMAPLVKSANFMRNQGNGLVYMYSFDYDRATVSPYWEATGGSRFLELMLIENYGTATFGFDQNDIYIRDIFSDMLTNFVKFYNPTPLGYTKSKNYWGTFGGSNCYFSVDINSTMMPQFYQDDASLWINSGALN